jgi:hypothetical protein
MQTNLSQKKSGQETELDLFCLTGLNRKLRQRLESPCLLWELPPAGFRQLDAWKK